MAVAALSPVARAFLSGERTVRYIFSDVDGTLLDPDQNLSPRVEAAVNAASDAGVPLIVATGKGIGPWVGRVLSRLKLTLPRIHLQGLAIIDPIKGPIRIKTLDLDVIDISIRVATSRGAFSSSRAATCRARLDKGA